MVEVKVEAMLVDMMVDMLPDMARDMQGDMATTPTSLLALSCLSQLHMLLLSLLSPSMYLM